MTQTVIEMAEAAEEFIRRGKWHQDTPQDVRDLVAMNIRGFWSFLHSNALEGCQAATDQACAARWHTATVVRGIPVFICADEFELDPSVGINGFGQAWAVRRDDGTVMDLTPEELEHWIGVASSNYEPFGDGD